MRTLYFERAGIDFYEEGDKKASDVGNFRIRTAFTVEGAKAPIYLEMFSSRVEPKDKRKFTEGYAPGDLIGWVDHCFYIGIPHPYYQTGQYESLPCERAVRFPYTLDGILNFVNTCIASKEEPFDKVEILDQYEDYHVHGNNGTYNLMDDFTPNPVRAEARRACYMNFWDCVNNIFNTKFPNFNVIKYDGDKMTFRFHCSDKELEKAGVKHREHTFDTSVFEGKPREWAR